MKKNLKSLLAVTLATVMLSSVTAHAAPPSLTEKPGTGPYSITVVNGDDTGISIAGDWFHAYQIFSADSITSYAVDENFKGFFVGDTMEAGDGTGDTFDFDAQLEIMNSTDGTYTALQQELAEQTYNQLAGQYMDSYDRDMYALAGQIRDFLDANGHYAIGTGGIECDAHSQAVAVSTSGIEAEAILVGLTHGYYFVMDQKNEVNGLGIAASGAFVPVGNIPGQNNVTVEVKNSIPTLDKQIYHNDKNKWDIVGDHQIGDEVKFLLTSTLPSNINEYVTQNTDYTYIITDTMSAGLTYNNNVKVYLDAKQEYEVEEELTITPVDAQNFKISVDVKKLKENHPDAGTLYTFYSATLNENAVVAKDFDKNTAELEYSNNPADDTQTGKTEDEVFHFTFALDINKVDEGHNGLAGARFGIFDDDGDALPLTEKEVTANGVVRYYYDKTAPVVADGGYIETREVELGDGTKVTGKFQIYGLDDGETYILREVEAPEGYNAVGDISFILTPTYDETGTILKSLTDGSGLIHTEDGSSSATIMNRKTIILPHTGGAGTVLFQVGGGALMVGAAAMLLLSKKKKTEK